MHPQLVTILDETIHLLEEDRRCLGAWHFGSLSRGLQDRYSDVDPVFLVADENFQAFDQEISSLFESLGYSVLLMWPEDFNSEKIKNYAILIKIKEAIVQYDFTIMNATYVDDPFNKIWYRDVPLDQIIFDRNDYVMNMITKAHTQETTSFDLNHHIEKYWLFAYLMVKYYCRKDVFKLQHTMNELFHCHKNLLLYAADGLSHWGSWADAIKHQLPSEHQDSLKAYFCSCTLEEIRIHLVTCIKTFKKDAEVICSNHQILYTHKLEKHIESYVLKHFNK